MNATRHWNGYLRGVIVSVACTAAGFAMTPRFDLANIGIVYLLGVIYVAAFHGRGAALLTSLLSIAAFDFLFVPPRWSFAFDDEQCLFTYAIILGLALVISRFASAMTQTDGIRNALLEAITRDLPSGG